MVRVNDEGWLTRLGPPWSCFGLFVAIGAITGGVIGLLSRRRGRIYRRDVEEEGRTRGFIFQARADDFLAAYPGTSAMPVLALGGSVLGGLVGAILGGRLLPIAVASPAASPRPSSPSGVWPTFGLFAGFLLGACLGMVGVSLIPFNTNRPWLVPLLFLKRLRGRGRPRVHPRWTLRHSASTSRAPRLITTDLMRPTPAPRCSRANQRRPRPSLAQRCPKAS
ncbi:hypothetical protein [Singulisphaera sp. PoT]|uniref:hypothetical protein n=1 Tax=Singulisphaera sp. PoT TaxID=3411797 RepID=UPI003BF58C7D